MACHGAYRIEISILTGKSGMQSRKKEPPTVEGPTAQKNVYRHPNLSFMARYSLLLCLVLGALGCEWGLSAYECRQVADCETGHHCSQGTCQKTQNHTPKKESHWQITSLEKRLSYKVDILFVIDNSGSMLKHQDKLSKSATNFIQNLKSKGFGDFHIGVISSDMITPTESGKLQPKKGSQERYIDSRKGATAEQVNTFRDMVKLGVIGSSYEKLLSAAKAALSPKLLQGVNKGFLRDDSQLIIIFITDEDDCSHNGKIDEARYSTSVCRFPQNSKRPDGSPGQLHHLLPISTFAEPLRYIEKQGRLVITGGIIGNPLSSGLSGFCVYKSPGNRICAGCKANKIIAYPAFRIFDFLKAFSCEKQWVPVCEDEGSYATFLESTIQLVETRMYTMTLQRKPETHQDGSPNIRVHIEKPGQSKQKEFIPRAKMLENTSCNIDSDCKEQRFPSAICGPKHRCRLDGWVYYPVSSAKPKPTIRFGGKSKQALREKPLVSVFLGKPQSSSP